MSSNYQPSGWGRSPVRKGGEVHWTLEDTPSHGYIHSLQEREPAGVEATDKAIA